MVRRASCDLQHQASLASHAAHARLRSPFPGRRRGTQACCCARAVPRWLWCARALSKGAVPVRAPFPSARARGATCQLRRPTPSQRRVSRGTGAPALAVSGEKAPHSGRAVLLVVVGTRHLRREPCRPEASLLRRTSVVRRASCSPQRQASVACVAWRHRRACACCLWGGGSARNVSARARLVALVVVKSCPMDGRRTGGRLVSFDARP